MSGDVKETELAAVATIRTALNYFLGREIKEERAELARQEPPAEDHTADPPHLR